MSLTFNPRKVCIKTYGCQMNVYDSQRIEELLGTIGFKTTEEPNDADLVLFNTCHIREKAAEKIYSELGKIREMKEEKAQKGNRMIIAVAGCVAQAEGEEMKKRAPYIDIVTGPANYHNLPDYISNIVRGSNVEIGLDFEIQDKFDLLPKERNLRGFSSFISIQEGCDKFCTFCVVPYTRGAEFSRPVEDVYQEVLQLVNKGSKEVSLLGQNVNAYHGKNKDEKEVSLAYLIAKLSEIDGLERIRYTTSHPINMTKDLIDEHGKNTKLMPYLHLPVQSGSNKILSLMNRKHDREEYFRIIENLRKVKPELSLSSDFIVAFPGETDEDFNDTIDLIKHVKFSQSYSFKYSPRPGTPAALKDQIDPKIAQERLLILQELLFNQQKEFNSSFLNKTIPVLFEDSNIRNGKNQITGKSPFLQAVSINSEKQDELLGKIINVKITEIKQNSLFGTLLA